ncbi:MAG TPA: hypothetical protein VFC19_49125 [Candidatus Limnocylindrales bacterium]|nr:hypothetical protein [Candidatus Limnocylindrales bacterium]
MSWIATADKALTAEQARTLTDGIRARVADLLPFIKQAYEGRADQALGYATWHEYCMAELSGIRIPLTDRPAAVAELRQNGMSTRAIGSALGIGQTQVVRDLSRLNTNGSVDQPERVVSLDGRGRPAVMPERPTSEPVPAPVEMPARQDVADAIVAGIEQNLNGHNSSKPDVERPKPPAWDPEERKAHEEEVLLRQDIEAARRGAETLVTDVRALIFTVLHGSRRGAQGLVTAEMIADLRKAVDLLEGEIEHAQ